MTTVAIRPSPQLNLRKLKKEEPDTTIREGADDLNHVLRVRHNRCLVDAMFVTARKSALISILFDNSRPSNEIRHGATKSSRRHCFFVDRTTPYDEES